MFKNTFHAVVLLIFFALTSASDEHDRWLQKLCDTTERPYDFQLFNMIPESHRPTVMTQLYKPWTKPTNAGLEQHPTFWTSSYHEGDGSIPNDMPECKDHAAVVYSRHRRNSGTFKNAEQMFNKYCSRSAAEASACSRDYTNIFYRRCRGFVNRLWLHGVRGGDKLKDLSA